MCTKIQVLSATDTSWNDLVELAPHDIYHTREYNIIAGLGELDTVTDTGLANSTACAGPQPALFVFQKNGMTFMFPFLLRTLEDVLGEEGRSYLDVGSAYGYGGPIASSNATPQFLKEAWFALLTVWREQGVISAFTRFHPLLDNVRLVSCVTAQTSTIGGQGVIFCGHTVSIDLSMPDQDQFRRYNKNLRNELRKAYSLGFEVSEVEFEGSASLFVDLYLQTMKRRNASGHYLIDREWLLRFKRSLGERCSLLAARLNGDVAAMLLVMEYNGFVQAHLTGTDNRFTPYSPLKPLLDGARSWAHARGNRIFHLGGGIGARHDSLFHFKRHFSPDLNQFHIGCWIVNPKIYRELSRDQDDLAGTTGEDPAVPKPFPAYRFVMNDQLIGAAKHP